MADLWGLVWGKSEVDPALLAESVEREAARGELDFRTRLLIRDSTDALAEHWGAERLRAWLERSPVRERIERIRGCAPMRSGTGTCLPARRCRRGSERGAHWGRRVGRVFEAHADVPHPPTPSPKEGEGGGG